MRTSSSFSKLLLRNDTPIGKEKRVRGSGSLFDELAKVFTPKKNEGKVRKTNKWFIDHDEVE